MRWRIIRFLHGHDFWWLANPCKILSVNKDLIRNATFLGCLMDLLLLITFFRHLPSGYSDNYRLTWDVLDKEHPEYSKFSKVVCNIHWKYQWRFCLCWEPRVSLCQFHAGWSLQLWRILESKQGCRADVLCRRLPWSAPSVLCQKNQQKFMLRCEQHSHVTVSSSSQKRRVLHDGELSRENCG